jgi:hypothetical protein
MAAAPKNGNRVRRALGVTLLLLVALVIGVVTAVFGVRAQFASGGVRSGAWASNAHIGSTGAGPYLRAGVALGGLLALNASETVYYTATTDDAGTALSTACEYRLEGSDPAARWWSITAYADDSFLIPGSNGRFSVDKTAIEHGTDGTFMVRVGGAPLSGNWISTGAPGGGKPFSLTLRLYNPDPSIVADLGRVALPRIVRERCS